MNLLSNYGSARYHNNPDDSQVAYDRIVWFYQSLCEKLSSPWWSVVVPNVVSRYESGFLHEKSKQIFVKDVNYVSVKVHWKNGVKQSDEISTDQT